MLLVYRIILNTFLYLKIAFILCELNALDATEKIGYKSYVLENETVVEFVPKLNLIDHADQCNFTIFEEDESIPSKSLSFNSTHLLLEPGFLNYEVKTVHFFKILARCLRSIVDKSISLELHVLDVNEFRPYFSQATYKTKYVENDDVKYVLKVLAYDADETNDHHVCGYKIITPNVPFNVTDDGFIFPLYPLTRRDGEKYTFKVVAIDCIDGSESEPSEVNVFVEEHCYPSWIERTDILPKADFPVRNVELLNCDYCEPVDIVARISLEPLNINKSQCDISECENEFNTFELLKGGVSDTEPTPDSVYSFNGFDDFLFVEHDDMDWTPSHAFSLSFWMRTNFSDSRTKRQILCQADALGLNRHHFSIFLRDGFLKLVLRQNPLPPPANHEFFPSQWSWKLLENGTEQWHFYKLDIAFPDVQLFIDHKLSAVKQADVINDYPLEAVFDNHTGTVLSVGACWHSRFQRYAQFFKGDLALLQYTRNRTRRVRCSRNCTERLELNDDNEEVAFNENRSVAVLRVPSLQRLHSLLKKIRYVNELQDTPARMIQISGTIVCKDMPKIQIQRFLKATELMKIFIDFSGPNILSITSPSLVTGIKPFGNVSIYGYAVNNNITTPQTILIQRCFVRMKPPSTIHEILSFPEDSPISVQHTAGGVLLAGAYSIEEYIKIIREFTFASTSHTVESFNFTLECSPSHDSNEYGKLEVAVIRRSPSQPDFAISGLPSHFLKSETNYKKVRARPYNLLSGLFVGIMITACSGAIVFGITLYVARQTTRKARQKLSDEMEWDDTALNIRINPLEQLNDYDNSSDNDEDRNDVDYSSDEHYNRGLEWDDSTMDLSEL